MEPVWRTRMFIQWMSDEEKERNRSYAMEALGGIGVASPEVITTLQHALNDTNDQVRFSALKAIYALHLQPERPLAEVLNSFSPRRDTSFKDIVDWTGHLGSEGQDALPWLQRLTAFDYMNRLPEGVHTNMGWDLAVSTEDLQAAATLAILEIDPSQINPREVNSAHLLRQFRFNWEATKRVRGESNATAVVTILKPFLISSNSVQAGLAANIVLGLAPHDEQALQTLRRCAGEGDLTVDRLNAAESLWMQTSNSQEMLHLSVEGLKLSPGTDQVAAEILATLGEDARPAIPALKDALWGQDQYGRYTAGEALQKIAPEELPPIY